MKTLKIPERWVESKYNKKLTIMEHQLMIHSLGYLSDHAIKGLTPKSSILNINEFLKLCYGEKKFGGTYYKSIRNSLKKLSEKMIIDSYEIDSGVLSISFKTCFIESIYGSGNIFRI